MSNLTLATTDVKAMSADQLKAELETLKAHPVVLRYQKVYNRSAQLAWTSKQKAKAASAAAELAALRERVQQLEKAKK